ncbi:hypothetical protein SPRG_03011 [Saprolegnia parasitica CBS 223.65]|uniref:Uncharacterized protein n=1 Tax=Saprolegnia parasitica (strain CBS 223.65) TaxID=695850 RepID=A0A067D178_SAPPC|nr:hypothetical protein SPRG_03011 [Saprolegnia parasitica CBS 223.65]KDO32536.1 hypothetical protein SPRG_03011 [Saprolegnia parasitica CBS 223.65]|eukprot:XP_012196982.1 hypothetical protein SPRG_03011 [Saprolegnia parasitica CBS 223.65]
MACTLCYEPRQARSAPWDFTTDDIDRAAFHAGDTEEIDPTRPPPSQLDTKHATPQPQDMTAWWPQDDDEDDDVAAIQGGGGAKKKTKAQVAYEAFSADPTQATIKSEILRKPLRGPKLAPKYHKSHYFDVEVAKDMVVKEVLRRHRDGQPAPDFLTEIVPIQKALCHRSNWRPLQATKNQGTERAVAACVMTDDETMASGHGLSKLVTAWQHIEKTLRDVGWAYAALRTAYASVTDEATGVSVIELAARRSADHAAVAAVEDATKDAFEVHVLQRLAKDGLLLRTADGRIDKRCAAVRSGDLTLKEDGSVDQRCRAYRAVLLSFSDATRDLKVSPTTFAALKILVRKGDLSFTTNGKVDRRCAAVQRGLVVVRADGKIDDTSPIVPTVKEAGVEAGPRRKDGELDRRAPAPSGPVRADGAPDMRYAANRSAVSNSAPATRAPSSAPSGPMKADGTPDMRYRANRR